MSRHKRSRDHRDDTERKPSVTVEEIRDWFRADPNRMPMMGARQFGLPEATVVRALRAEWQITELRLDAFKEIMEALRDLGKLRVFVRSRAAVTEMTGTFREFSEAGGFFNVGGDTIDLHIIPRELEFIFAIERPGLATPDQRTYSVQFFDKQGDAAFKVFLWENSPNLPEATAAKFHEATDRYATPH